MYYSFIIVDEIMEFVAKLEETYRPSTEGIKFCNRIIKFLLSGVEG